MSVFLLACDDDDYPYAEVPSVVLNEFWAHYPDAQDAEFHETGKKYEVEFEIDSYDHAAVFDLSGNLLKEKREVSWKKLPLELQQSLQQKFGKEKIEDPEWVKQGEEIHYQAEIDRFFFDEKIVLSEKGNIEEQQEYWK